MPLEMSQNNRNENQNEFTVLTKLVLPLKPKTRHKVHA